MYKKCKNVFFLAISGLIFLHKDYLIAGQLQSENVSALAIRCQGMGISSLSEKKCV